SPGSTVKSRSSRPDPTPRGRARASPRAPSSDTPEGRVRVDLPVLDELDGGQAFRVEDRRELLHRGGFAMDPIRLFVAPHEEMDEARRMIALLPHLVTKGSRLVRANVRNELVDCGNHFVQRLRADLIARQLMNLTRIALDMSHVRSSWYP